MYCGTTPHPWRLVPLPSAASWLSFSLPVISDRTWCYLSSDVCVRSLGLYKWPWLYSLYPSTPQFPNTMLTPTILNPLRLPFASNSRRLARSVISARSMAGLAPSKKAVDPVVLPEMQLSNHDNPLTAPISLKDTPIAERAAKRFAVHGNAIGTHLSTF